MGSEIKPGDIVELKSGGPWMTVRCFAMRGIPFFRKENRDIVFCVWFNEEESIRSHWFREKMLWKPVK